MKLNGDHHLTFSITAMSLQELTTIRTLFSQYDTDLSGELASAEIGYLLQVISIYFKMKGLDILCEGT